MAKYGKWIGGGLGWALGGPIGGIFGFMFGSMFDGVNAGEYAWHQPIKGQDEGSRNYTDYESYDEHNYQRGNEYGQTETQTQAGDFTVSLMILAAAVMKADGKILKSELEYVKQFLRSQFNEQVTQQSIMLLREILKKDYSLNDVTQQIGRQMDYSSKLQLLHFLFGVALADGHIHSKEVDVIETISRLMGIRMGDYNSIKAMFIKNNFNNYKILEITPDANNDEIKTAYRKMAVKYHPDKVSHLGPDIQESAKKKFQTLSAAYEAIKKERGIK